LEIRNFSIIAHIDHGKSTLADRLLEYTHTVSKREMRDQLLDDMDLERERGITIKAKAVRMIYKGKYILNLIDTPGHVDFTYEVSRAMAACEGALLIVDATQGVEAQTVANAYLAQETNLKIIPVINKIDLPASNPTGVAAQIKEVLHLGEAPLCISAKEGLGIPEVLDAIIERVPPYQGDNDKPLSALVFDSLYDSYRGVIIYFKIIEGMLQKGKKLKFFSTGMELDPIDMGYLTPQMVSCDTLAAGEVGYLATGIKDIHEIKIGDTLTTLKNPTTAPHSGYKELKPYVFVGMYPINPADYNFVRDAIEKLRLEDSSFQYEPETSHALGFGFRCGFLGLLHMDIIKERIRREFKLEIIVTAPNVIYRIMTEQGDIEEISNPANFPSHKVEAVDEPFISARIICPKEYVGGIMPLCQDRRGQMKQMHYITTDKVMLEYLLPLGEVILDFYDQLKSVSRGYASLDYEPVGWKPGNLVKVEILLQGKVVDAFSNVVDKEKAYQVSRKLAEKLKEVIPRQMYQVSIQARVNNKIIARESIPAMRKDVLAKCYGGDISRKRKLLEKQKEGKKRMKQFADVEIPQEAFLSVLNLDNK